jgi:hypothetical protein
MNRERPRQAKSIRLLAVILVAAFIIWLIFLSFPDPKNSLIDFSEFYCAGRILRHGQAHLLYDLKTQAACLDGLGQVTVFYNHPPFEALLYLALTYLNFHTAYVIWTMIGVLLLLIAAFRIDQSTQVSRVLAEITHIPVDTGLLFIIFLTFSPATTSLLLGQDSILMLLVYVITLLMFQRGREFTAGCVLACGLFKFTLVAPLALILLLRGKWRVLKGFTTVGSALVLLSIAVAGMGALTCYPRFLLFDTLYQQIGGFAPDFMPNLRGILYLVTSGYLPRPWFGALLAAASLLVLWITARSWQDDRLEISFSAAILATLLASYHLYNYDLTLALLPISILVAQAGTALRRSRLLALSLAVLLIPPLHRWLLLHEIYPLMGLAILGLLFSAMRMSRMPPYPPAPREAKECAAASLVP